MLFEVLQVVLCVYLGASEYVGYTFGSDEV